MVFDPFSEKIKICPFFSHSLVLVLFKSGEADCTPKIELAS